MYLHVSRNNHISQIGTLLSAGTCRCTVMYVDEDVVTSTFPVKVYIIYVLHVSFL